MKSFSLALALLASASLALAATESVTLFEENFEGLTAGPMLGQAGALRMYSTASGLDEDPGIGMPPAPDMPGVGGVAISEVAVIAEPGAENQYLYVSKMKAELITTADGTKDRGVRIPLNWGETEYAEGANGRFVITGRYYGSAERGYAELRLSTTEGAKTIPVFRFSPFSSDYKTYIYQTANYATAFQSFTLNSDDARICKANRNQMPVADAYRAGQWVNFEIVINAGLCLVESYKCWNDSFSYENNVRCKVALSKRPDFIEFTAVGNGFNTNRYGAGFDDLKVVYEKDVLNYVTVFSEDFSSYAEGESIFDVAPQYPRLSDAECMSARIAVDSARGNYLKLWMQNPPAEQKPKDGIRFPFPASLQFPEGSRIVVAADIYIPDNGIWSKLVDASGDTLFTIGYHTASKWFYNWDGSDEDNLYEILDNAHVGCWYTVAHVVDIVEGKPVMTATRLEDHGHDSDTRAYGFDWNASYGTELAELPAGADFQVQGWPEKDVRWLGISDVKFGYVAPEPGLLALLGLAVLALLRRR